MSIFNLSEQEINYVSERRIYCLVIYDITDNKQRLKLSKFLEGYGVRVQRSCFELFVRPSTYRSIVDELPNYLDTMDSIIVYRLDHQYIDRFCDDFIDVRENEDIIFL